jgi:hypothetical protein
MSRTVLRYDLMEAGLAVLEIAKALPDEVLHAPITHAEKLYPLCDAIQRFQRASKEAVRDAKEKP